MKEKIISLLETVQREGMQDLINYLESSDYFTAPASTKYHSCHPGGLAEHSLNVYKLLEHKNKVYKLEIPQESIIIIALLHDLCKVDFYATEKKSVLKGKIKVMKNRKVDGEWKQVEEEVNDWQEEDTYTVKDQFPAGHGEKSVIILQKYIKLTDFEIMAIRWHMGFSEQVGYSFNNVLELMPSIIAIYTADLEASYILEGRKNDE